MDPKLTWRVHLGAVFSRQVCGGQYLGVSPVLDSMFFRAQTQCLDPHESCTTSPFFGPFPWSLLVREWSGSTHHSLEKYSGNSCYFHPLFRVAVQIWSGRQSISSSAGKQGVGSSVSWRRPPTPARRRVRPPGRNRSVLRAANSWSKRRPRCVRPPLPDHLLAARAPKRAPPSRSVTRAFEPSSDGSSIRPVAPLYVRSGVCPQYA